MLTELLFTVSIAASPNTDSLWHQRLENEIKAKRAVHGPSTLTEEEKQIPYIERFFGDDRDKIMFQWAPSVPLRPTPYDLEENPDLV